MSPTAGRTRSGHSGAANSIPHLPRMIGNQALQRLLGSQDVAGGEAHARTDTEVEIEGPESMPVEAPPVVSRLARNPEVSPLPVQQESPLVSSLAVAPLDAPAMREREADANSSLRVTSNFAGSNPTFKNIGPLVVCQSPRLSLTGQISVAAARANGDLTVGFMQALLSSTGPKGHYFDANDAPYMTAFQPYATPPLRDADPSGTFYGPEAQSTVNSPSVSVSMADAPQAAVVWSTPDKRGTLQQISGEEQFVTWLVTKSDETGRIVPLRYITWSVGWFAAVDQSQPSGTSFDVGKITDAGGGSGPMTPIRSGPVANDSKLPTQWEPWK